MEFPDVFNTLFGVIASLATAFGGTVWVVTSVTAYVKDMFEGKLKGWAARLLSLGLGAALGGLILWVAFDAGLQLTTAQTVFVSVLFLLGTGLTASGYYDFKNENKEPY